MTLLLPRIVVTGLTFAFVVVTMQAPIERVAAMSPDQQPAPAGRTPPPTGDTSLTALEVANQKGEPRIDSIEVRGAERTREPVIADRLGLHPKQILSAESFRRAARRLQDLPVVSTGQMSYERVAGGRAKVVATVEERVVAPHGLMPLATLAGAALIRRQVRLDVAGPAGAGEVWSAMGRWAKGRPRLELSLAAPAPRRLPGVMRLEGSWEHQWYGATNPSTPSAPTREDRRRVEVGVADWATSRLHWSGGAAFDRFARQDALAVSGALDARAAGDRISLRVSAGSWTPLADADRYGTAEVGASWRSTTDPAAASWSGETTIALASEAAPHALWFGAGTGAGRPLLLRAHPLLVEGFVTGPVFGRRVAHTSVEYEHPLPGKLAGRVAVAGFVDAAKAWRRRDSLATSRLFVDAGIGLRVHAPGMAGTIRLDVGQSLRDRGTAFSAGWGQSWPR